MATWRLGEAGQLHPDIAAFHQAIWSNPEERQALQQRLAAAETAAQARLGQFSPGDLRKVEVATLEGINLKRRWLHQVALERFALDVEDADTLILRRKGFFSWAKSLAGLGEIQVRLSGIDAPEVAGHTGDPLAEVRFAQEQPGGQEATEYLQSRAASGDLSLLVDTRQKSYGRYLGGLWGSGGENIQLEMVREGIVAALPFGPRSRDITDRSALAQAEEEARQERLGLWSMQRYQAIAGASGQRTTFNTLTRLDKLAGNLWMGMFASHLEAMGGTSFSGRDDDYNTIEGLGHSGIAWQLRRQGSSFGSGWDPLRALAKEALGITGKRLGEDAFRRYIKSSVFQQALTSGRVIQELGQGSFGSVQLMETMVSAGGKKQAPFKYVRKQFTDFSEFGMSSIEREIRSMKKLGDINVPSYYGRHAPDPDLPPAIFSEYMPGKSASAIMRSGGKLTEHQVAELESGLQVAHARGIAHLDIWRRAKQVTGAPRWSRLEAGEELVPHNVIISPEGRVGIIDWGLGGSAHEVGPLGNLFTPEMTAAGRHLAGSQIDMVLIDALKRQSGGLSTGKAVLTSAAPLTEATKTRRSHDLSLAFGDTLPGPRVSAILSGSAARTLRKSQAQVWKAGISGGKGHRSYGSINSAAKSMAYSTAVDIIGEMATLPRVF